MCGKLVYLVSVVLVLSLASTTYGIVIGDFENEMDGWVRDAQAPEGLTIDYNDTIGVTLNNYSLKMYVPIGQIGDPDWWWIQSLYLNLMDPNVGLVEEFFNSDTFSMDVTRLVPDWPPTTNWQANAFIFVIDAQSDLGTTWSEENYLTSEYWSTTDPDPNLPRTIVFDYSAVKAQIDPCSVSYLNFFLILKTANYTEGTYYFDNFQLYSDVLSRNPSPADGATDVPRDTVLSWTPGSYADTHDVYIGTDFNDVNEVNIANLASYPNVDFNNVDVNYYDPGTLELNTTYYWRVDEVNDANLWPGPVWSFTTADYLVVDDIESYNGLLPNDPNNNRIWHVWKEGFGYGSAQYPPIYCGNGTGSAVGDVTTDSLTEETIVHGGGQSMPYYYDNTATGWNWCDEQITVFYSEAERTFDEPQDWTAEGVMALSLWFYGDPNNDANTTEQMYVKVNGVKVLYDGSMHDIKEPWWHEWSIDLAEFTGVDPMNITSLAIGFGDEDNTTMPGGSGKVYFDDIRLHRPRCVPSRRKPVGDFNGDCQVGYGDLDLMVDDWLVADYTADPLIAWYKLDDGSGTTAVDSSANGNDGTLVGSPVWVGAGQIGGALQFDDGNDYVDDGNSPVFNPPGSFSITLWAYITDWSQEWSHVMISRRGEEGIGWQLRRNGTYWGLGDPNGICFSTGGAGHLGTGINDTPTDTTPPLNEWIHIAAVYDKAGSMKRIYLNGVEDVAYHTNAGTITPTTHNVYIGARANADNTGPEGFFRGMLDDVRLYDKALSQPEIENIMAGGDVSVSHYHPVQSPAELYGAEAQGSRVVNFRDIAVWAEMWLEEPQLWPGP